MDNGNSTHHSKYSHSGVCSPSPAIMKLHCSLGTTSWKCIMLTILYHMKWSPKSEKKQKFKPNCQPLLFDIWFKVYTAKVRLIDGTSGSPASPLYTWSKRTFNCQPGWYQLIVWSWKPIGLAGLGVWNDSKLNLDCKLIFLTPTFCLIIALSDLKTPTDVNKTCHEHSRESLYQKCKYGGWDEYAYVQRILICMKASISRLVLIASPRKLFVTLLT